MGADSAEILNHTYLLLTTQERIDEAAKYAQMSMLKGDKGNFIHFVIMANQAKNNNFDAAIENLDKIKDKSYQQVIVPLFKAWLYTAKDEKEKALEQLEILKNEKENLTLYHMHKGMINDYFKDIESATADFNTIISNKNLDLSYRSLQIITNFYIRNNQSKKAIDLIKSFSEKSSNTKVFISLLETTDDVDKNRTIPLIKNPQQGLGEALFYIGSAFLGFQADIAQIFIALSLYLNPENDIAIITSADIFEKSDRIDDAIHQYNKLDHNSPLYYMAKLKISSILMENKKYDESLENLKNMLKQYPDDYSILFNLGEVSRITDNNKEAIKYYNSALKNISDKQDDDWTVYYALGMAYDRNNQWPEAEKVLKKALTISNRHPFILNYLGYMWLENNQNYNEALYMIFEAYQQNPESGHIMDSMGWALYRMGKYDDALKVLEKAAEYLPANAVVCDHLGDVYWQTGRKSEAKYQWQHALALKEDSELLDKELINQKIKDGAPTPKVILYNEALLIERLKSLAPSN